MRDETDTRRKPVNKTKAAAKFRRQVAKTKVINVAPSSARGGYRL